MMTETETLEKLLFGRFGEVVGTFAENLGRFGEVVRTFATPWTPRTLENLLFGRFGGEVVGTLGLGQIVKTTTHQFRWTLENLFGRRRFSEVVLESLGGGIEIWKALCQRRKK